MASWRAVTRELQSLATPKRASASAWFFKTGPGQYGAGDKLIGIRVPAMRQVAHQYVTLSLANVKRLLQSPIHEYRFVALEILVAKYERGDGAVKKQVYDFYIKSTKFINNWDLVDTSVGYIVGDYLLTHPRAVLYRWVKSKNLWERRMAIVATQAFIAQGQFADTLKLVRLLLNDRHDLIHKACGWMLREVGKKSSLTLTKFLNQNATRLPRTMLRYAIERFPRKQQLFYLQLGKPKKA